MIRVKRGALPSGLKAFFVKSCRLGDGVTECTLAERELDRAVVFFTDPKHYCGDKKLTEKSFSFSVYKDAELSRHLESVFEGKCAYCESRFAHVTPKDVEHYRPKASIETDGGELLPGYYWLAADWDNLLVSCPDCNRSRNHQVPGQPKAVRLGKASQFPLADERRRVRAKGPLTKEEKVRLLLDPCRDDPEKHFAYSEDGLILPRKVGGKLSRAAEVSIAVYALQRKGLVEERRRVLNDLKFFLEQLEEMVVEYHGIFSTADEKSREKKLRQIRRQKDKLAALFAKDAPYQGMLRDWIRKTAKAGRFAELRRLGVNPARLLRSPS